MTKTTSYLLTISLLAFAAAPSMAKEAPPKDLYFYLNYQLIVAADGSIEKLTLQSENIKPVLAENLEKQIRSWGFSPGAISGVPARTESNLWLAVNAKPSLEGSYEVRVADAGTGAWMQGALVPPQYPSNSLRLGHEAVLLLTIKFDAEGKVTSVERPGKKLKGMAPFEQASIRAAQQWRFKPEKVGGIGIPGSVIVPVKFCTADNDCRGLLSGNKEKEKLARQVAQQLSPGDSLVAIQRPILN
jgi:TonB family protein